MKIRIQHRTTYRYSQDVNFGRHRIMLRPREGHDIKIESSILEINPAHKVRWTRDMNGNSVALVDFTAPGSELMIYSELLLNHFEANPFDFILEPEAISYPFAYNEQTHEELGLLRLAVYPDDVPVLREWLNRFWQPGQQIDTMVLLQGINFQIPMGFKYQSREEEGVQTPAETLRKGSGSCRDFATLLVESCRFWGLAARFVSGYMLSGAGGASTHAWVEVYLPGGGWKGFDPTLGLLTTSQHVAVAVSRHPQNAMPISGSFGGPASAFQNISVDVHVEQVSE